MLGKEIKFSPRESDYLLRDYPNSLYYNGFDFSVQAGGYNSFHEMRNLGLPDPFLSKHEYWNGRSEI